MKRSEQKLVTHCAAVAAARKLWGAPGAYDTASIRDIAAEMNMSIGAIYGNFQDKEALWRAAFNDTPPPVDSALTRAAPAMAEALRRLLELRGRPESDPEVEAAWEAARASMRG